MRVELSDDVLALTEVIERILSDHSSPADVRSSWQTNYAGPVQLWGRLAPVGLATLTQPVEQGGEGLDLVALMPVLHAAGKVAATSPLVETIGGVCPILAGEPDSTLACELLDEIASGAAMATVQDGWGGHAPWAASAGVVLVMDGDDVFICRPNPDQVEPLFSVDPSRRLGRVLPAAKMGRLLLPGSAERLRRYLLVSSAAFLYGLSEGVLNMSVEYALVRKQFGRQIGSFQALKHEIASTFARWEYTRRYVWYAAWVLSHRPHCGAAVASRAKALAGDIAIKSSYTGLQVYGGIGYTWDCDLQLWLKRIQVMDATYGSSDVHWDALAQQSTAPGLVG